MDKVETTVEETEIMATLPIDELMEVIEDSEFLKCLMANGVSEWAGFESSLVQYKKAVEDGKSRQFFN